MHLQKELAWEVTFREEKALVMACLSLEGDMIRLKSPPTIIRVESDIEVSALHSLTFFILTISYITQCCNLFVHLML